MLILKAQIKKKTDYVNVDQESEPVAGFWCMSAAQRLSGGIWTLSF